MTIPFEPLELLQQKPPVATSLDDRGKWQRANPVDPSDSKLSLANFLPTDELAQWIVPLALDALNVGVLATDASRRIVFTNNRAHQLLGARDGLQRSSQGTLEASRSADRAPLETLLKQIASFPNTAQRRILTLALRRDTAMRPLTVVAQSLRSMNSNSPAVLIFALDPERPMETPEFELRQLHGITASEARLANLLMEGNTLEECCAQLDIQISTARMHLGSLFAKTGVQRQSQLVAMLLSSVGAINASPDTSGDSPTWGVSPRSSSMDLIGTGLEALDGLYIGVAVTDDARQLLFANRVASRLFQTRDGLELSARGTVRPLHCSSSFRDSGFSAAKRSDRNGELIRSTKLLAVARGCGRRPLTLMVRRLALPLVFGNRQPTLMIFILDPERPLQATVEGIRQLYGLTPSEARLANLLMQGNALDACCEQLEIRDSTARMHLSNLFMKTGVQRQGQLISLLVKSLGVLRFRDSVTQSPLDLPSKAKIDLQSKVFNLSKSERGQRNFRGLPSFDGRQ